jgi:glycosyltransferase involved in cell wall biosynthesis
MSDSAPPAPELSLVMPCYNEQDAVGYTIPQLVAAFRQAGLGLEVIAVDNGSTDRTGEILAGLANQGLPVVPIRVARNEGYGHGILSGFPHCRAPWVGAIPADGQVDAEDVVRLFRALRQTHGRVLGKVRRRFRLDGVWRKFVSIAYNGLVLLLWPRLGSIDVNGTPKIFPRALLPELALESKRWFLDPELMIKAHHLGVRVLEMNVFARMRGNGLSHVRAGTCWEFLRNLVRYRCTRHLARWRRDVAARTAAAPRREAPR